jgi:transcriptional regulatory protein LevR
MIYSILNEAKMKFDNDVKIGILMHIIFLIEKLLQGEKGKTFAQLNDYLSTNQSFIDQVEKKMLFLEKEYAVKIPQDEIAFIAQSFLENSKSKNNVDKN